MHHTKVLTEKDFVCVHADPDNRIGVDLVYAQVDHPDNMFVLEQNGVRTSLYKPDAVLSVHQGLFTIVMDAVKKLPEGLTVSLKDSLRTTDAQTKMGVIKDKNKWPDNLVSPAGVGGHPRGMAIDLMVCKNGMEVDVGTSFDFFDTENIPPRSSRFSPHLSSIQRNHQRLMERAIISSAFEHGQIILPLLDEHWDYRFASGWPNTKDFFTVILDHLGVQKPSNWEQITINDEADFQVLWGHIVLQYKDPFQDLFGTIPQLDGKAFYFINDYAPLSDKDLPSYMRLCS